MESMALRKRLMMLGIGLLLLAAGLPVSYLAWPARTPPPVTIDSEAIRSLGQLQSHAGGSGSDWQGERWALIFFGLTRCADVCPATLSRMASVLDSLGDQAEQIQPIFITLDPEQDTAEQLAAYISFFDERILGLTGTQMQVAAVAEAWGVYWRRVPVGGSYMLDHSTSLFLLRPDGQLAQRFSGQQSGNELVAELERLLASF